MAIGSKFLGAATLLFAFSSSVQAETLASANAFACGVDGPTAYSNEAATAPKARYAQGAYPGAGLDPDMPSMVKLRIIYEHADRIEIDHCGGTVVDQNWIVTAAHCVAADTSWDRVEVLAGDTNLDGGNIIRRVSRNAVCHSGFDFNGLKDDIALIRLEQPLPYEITPARIDRQNAPSVRQGGTALAAGWPVTGRKAGDRRLNKTQLSIVDAQVPGYITAVSAYGGAEGVCRGESGGPLMAHGPLGLQLAGVLSGIQPGTENAGGQECMLSRYEMYFTPLAAFRNWMDNVRSVCSRNPGMCAGSGSSAIGMMLARAPAYNGAAAPAYAAAPAQPTYQPTYTPAQPTYTPAQPTYVAQSVPTYTPVAQTAPTYTPVAQSTYIDVTSQYQAYNGGYSVPTTPIYQSVTYPVAQTYAAPTTSYSTSSNYIDLGYVDVTNSYAPAVTQYQNTSYQNVQPTYVDTTAQYQHVGSYDSTYSVAYVNQPVNAGSTFLLHAW